MKIVNDTFNCGIRTVVAQPEGVCSSDLHIKHGSVPRAVPGITVGHEMVGVVEDGVIKVAIIN